MPTLLNNQANITYNYAGAQAPGVANSNTTTTTLLDEYSMTAVKSSLSGTFRPGEKVTYLIQVTNSGMGSLHNIVVSDDLGASSGRPLLTYLQGTGRVFMNHTLTPVNPAAPGDTITFSLPNVLAAGDSALLMYEAVTASGAGTAVTPITNTATVTANGGSATGPAVTVTPNPSTTVQPEAFAEVSIYKQASQQSVVSGDPLTYTFTLTNTGNQEAVGVVLTDAFPSGFSVNSVTAITNHVTTTYSPSEYTIDAATNTITLPTGSGRAITVPAASGGTPGVTTINITGAIS